MRTIVKFMVAPAGRVARIVAGIALIAGGLLAVTGTAGIVLAVVGLVPLAFGLVDGCLFAPIFGYHLSGPRTRATL
jgi:hypothetical protein